MANYSERDFFLSKDFLDTLNSLSWFFMDALWMLGYTSLAEVMIPLTILSAIFLIYIEKKLSLFFINLGILFWILMNVTWMISEARPEILTSTTPKVFFAMGVFSILVSVFTTQNIKETFSHFKRFRIKKYFRN